MKIKNMISKALMQKTTWQAALALLGLVGILFPDLIPQTKLDAIGKALIGLASLWGFTNLHEGKNG